MLLQVIIELILISTWMPTIFTMNCYRANEATEMKCVDMASLGGIKDIMEPSFEKLILQYKSRSHFSFSGPVVYTEFENIDSLEIQNGMLVTFGKAFRSFTSLKHLNISGIYLEIFPSAHLLEENLVQTLDASRNYLKDPLSLIINGFPRIVNANLSANHIRLENDEGFQESRTLEYMDLSDNQIRQIKSRFFEGLKNLRKLILSSNAIVSLENSGFAGLELLEELDLSKNSLEEFEPGAFYGLFNLTHLDLKDNDVKHLKESQFINLVSIQKLDVSHNDMKVLKSKTFVNLPTLVTLLLNDNDLQSLESTVFSELPSLSLLDLSNNILTTLDGNSFGSSGLPQLKTLILESNSLSTITENAFTNLPGLQTLLLSKNQLAKLAVGTFAPLRNLAKLELSRNRLHELDADMFKNLTNLKELYVDENRLTSIRNPKNDYARLRLFLIDGNPWQCSCYDELTAFLDTKNISYVQETSPYHQGKLPLCIVYKFEHCEQNMDREGQFEIYEQYISIQ